MARDLSLGSVRHGTQDWGVEAADPARVDEFVAWFGECGAELSAWVAAECTDLVLQSAEEALEAEMSFDLEGLRQFVTTADAGRVEYWLGLRPTDEDRWLVSAYLRGWAEASELSS